MPVILPLSVVMTKIKFPNKKALKCLWVSKVIDIGLLIPDTLPQIILEVMKALDIYLLIQSNITQVITEVVDVGLF